jgi:hypothetical protein
MSEHNAITVLATDGLSLGARKPSLNARIMADTTDE